MSTPTKSALTLEERVNAAVRSGHLPADDPEVERECARRYIAERQRTRQRGYTRDAERAAMIRRTANARARMNVRVLLSEHSEWLTLQYETFTVNGVEVTFGDATVLQLTQRAEYLEMQAAGLYRSAEIVRQLIVDLTAAGVDTLTEAICAL